MNDMNDKSGEGIFILTLKRKLREELPGNSTIAQLCFLSQKVHP